MNTYLKVLVLRVGAALAAGVSLFLLAIYIDPREFGRYSLYLATVTPAAVVVVGWGDGALTRFGREEWRAHGRMGNALAARLVLYAASVALALGAAAIANEPLQRLLGFDSSPLPWLAGGLLVLPAIDIGLSASLAAGQSAPYGYVPFLARVGFLMAVVALPIAHVDGSSSYLIASLLTSSAVAAVVALLLLPKRGWGDFRLTFRALRESLGYSWALPAGRTAFAVTQWVDPWMLRGFLGFEAVGVYVWGYQTLLLAGFALTPLIPLLTSAGVDLRLTGELGQLKGYGERSLRWMILVGVAGAIAITLVAPILATPIGLKYQAAFPVVVLLGCGVPFQFLAALLTPLASAFEVLIPKLVAVNLLMAVVNALGDLALIPVLGISGPALATVASLVVSSLLQLAIVMRHQPQLRLPAPAKFALAGLIMPPGAAALLLGGPATGAVISLVAALLALLTARLSGTLAPKAG